MRCKNITLSLSSGAMVILILDSKSAFDATFGGVMLCLQTIIPSLFPFFLLSALLTASLTGRKIPLLTPLERLLRIPRGAGSLFLIGALGGYPVGARCIRQAYEDRTLSREDACRMIAFCSNAGPSFLFGIIAPCFPHRKFAWILWAIHIGSAMLVGAAAKGGASDSFSSNTGNRITLSQAMEQSIRTMAMVCGWVILFRLLISFPARWLFWSFPKELCVLLTGLTELSNGCILLKEIPSVGNRLLTASAMLGFGGICVAMQTRSIWGDLPFGNYLRGKLMQTLVSVLLCMDYLWLASPGECILSAPVLVGCHILFAVFGMIFRTGTKKLVAIPV